MTFGEQGKEGLPPHCLTVRLDTNVLSYWTGARVHDLKDVNAILDVFQKHGHFEVRSSQLPSPSKVKEADMNCPPV